MFHAVIQGPKALSFCYLVNPLLEWGYGYSEQWGVAIYGQMANHENYGSCLVLPANSKQSCLYQRNIPPVSIQGLGQIAADTDNSGQQHLPYDLYRNALFQAYPMTSADHGIERSSKVLTSKEKFGALRWSHKGTNIPMQKENFEFLHIGKTQGFVVKHSGSSSIYIKGSGTNLECQADSLKSNNNKKKDVIGFFSNMIILLQYGGLIAREKKEGNQLRGICRGHHTRAE